MWLTSITPFVLLRIFPFRTFSRPFTLTGFAEIFMPIYCRLYFQLFSGITFLKMGLFLNLGNLNLSVITVSGLYNVTKLDLYDYDCCFFHQINHSRRKNAKKATWDCHIEMQNFHRKTFFYWTPFINTLPYSGGSTVLPPEWGRVTRFGEIFPLWQNFWNGRS